MGLIFWLYDRSLEPTERYITEKFGKSPAWPKPTAAPCTPATTMARRPTPWPASFSVHKADLPPGTYRNITGNQALAWGLVAAADRSGCDLFYGSYPITPASDILHELVRHKNFGVRTFQAEDEIAAVTSAIGAAFGGAMGVTASSGPGIALKTEAHRPGRDDRIAAGDHQRAARRSEHGLADQDRTSRPVAGGVWPQRRMPACR